MRLFAAVPLSASVKSGLQTLSQAHPNDYHITLRFIGDVDETTASQYSAALKTVQAAPFWLTIARVGRFPEDATRLPKVLWVGVNHSPELMALQQAVSGALEASGLPRDKFAAYTPHITVARFRGDESLSDVSAFVEAHAADIFTPDPQPITAFVLYQSLRDASGGHYQEIERFELTG